MKKLAIPYAVVLLALVAMSFVACQGQQQPTETQEPPETQEPSETQKPPETREPETVTFPDENLEAAIRDALGKPADEEITAAELATLTSLHVDFPIDIIADLSGLEYCTNLTVLYLWFGQISDLTPLSNLTNLAELYFMMNQINDISPLSSLTNLTMLDIGLNQISDLTPLSNLTNLAGLTIYDNQISDISPLSNLTNLAVLHLHSNQISDISPLSNLTNLTLLYLWDNQISNISPLVENSGLGTGDEVWLEENNLDLGEGSEDMKNIRVLEDRGVAVYYLGAPGSTTPEPATLTYTNSEYGFYLDYPADWDVEETWEGSVVAFCGPTVLRGTGYEYKVNITVWAEQLPEDMTLIEYVLMFDAAQVGSLTGSSGTTFNDYTISGIPAVQWSCTGDIKIGEEKVRLASLVYIFIKDHVGYVIAYDVPVAFAPEYIFEFTLVTSSFKFE